MQHDGGSQLSKAASGHPPHSWSLDEKIISQFSAGVKSVHVLGNEIVYLCVENECALIVFWPENKGAGKKIPTSLMPNSKIKFLVYFVINSSFPELSALLGLF